MDKIILKGLSFQAKHGFFPEEKKTAQNFIIDAVVLADLDPAGKTDDLSKTINYAVLYEIIKTQVMEKTYDLIEALANQIAFDLLNFRTEITEVVVTIYKPNPPVEGNYDYFAVEIRRDRQWLMFI